MFKKISLVISASLIIIISLMNLGFAKAEIKKDISYGNLDRQKYDIYLPKTVDAKTPVLFFIYGGGWESGEKSIYSFVGKSFSKKGFITAIPDYRLFPEVSFPAFVEDTALAFAEVRKKYPNRKIFVAGHSAGAQIGALLAFDKKYLRRHSLSSCGSIAGFIGLAGPYDFEVTKEKFEKIFPLETRPQSQAVNFANTNSPATLLLHGAIDTTVHAEDSTILTQKLKAAGNDAEVKIYPAVGHINIVTALSPLLGILAPTKNDMVKFMRANANQASDC